MRRVDRQLGGDAAYELLEKGKICHLAMVAEGEPYLVTMNYGYRDGALYFHAAQEGRKMEALGNGSRVCFTVVPRHELVVAEKACGYSMKYESVVGWGKARMVEDPGEKRRALGVIMAQYAPGVFEFPDDAVAATAVFIVEIEELTGKSNF